MAQQNNNQSEIDVGQLSFERAIEELESIVRRLGPQWRNKTTIERDRRRPALVRTRDRGA